ncbi:MAG: hypothetical protein U0271_22815 [Polyangiaceae bacterium]
MQLSMGSMVRLALTAVFAASLTGCPEETDTSTGGQGGQGGQPPTEEGPQLFVLSLDSVASVASADKTEGRAEPKTTLGAGADTDMYGPRDVAISSSGELYVACENGPSINVYAGADQATGATLPSRKLSGANTGLEAPIAIAIAGDNLFAVNNTSNGATNKDIMVFSGLSSIDGDQSPARRIQVDMPLFSPTFMLENSDKLYVVNQDVNTTEILVFGSASSTDGLVAPEHVIANAEWGQALSLYVDASDTLWAVDEGSQIFRYDGASSLDESSTPSAVLDVTGAEQLSGLAFDPDGNLFAADRSTAFVYVFDAPVATSGGLTPSRSFDAVAFRSPSRLVIMP